MGTEECLQLLQGHEEPVQRRRQVFADELLRDRHFGSDRQRGKESQDLCRFTVLLLFW